MPVIKKLVILLIGLAVLGAASYGGMLGIGYFSTTPARHTGSAFVMNLGQQNLVAAYGLFDPSLQEKLTLEQFKEMNTQVNLTQFNQVNWSEWEILDGKHIITGRVRSMRGFETKLTLTLLKGEDGKEPRIVAFDFAKVSAEDLQKQRQDNM